MPKMTANQRTAFVKDFLKQEARGNAVLTLLLPILVQLFTKLLEAFLAKNGEDPS